MTLFVALAFPATIAMGLLAVDAVRAYSQASQINFATQAAALAAGSQLGNYYSQGAANGTTAISAAASTIANANVANLSNVTSSTTVTLGNWDSVSSTFTGLAAGSTSPNAVQVIGSATINTILASSFVGQSSLTVSKTAVATLGSPKTFNVIVLNEMGGTEHQSRPGRPRVGTSQLVDPAAGGGPRDFELRGGSGQYRIAIRHYRLRGASLYPAGPDGAVQRLGQDNNRQ